MPGNLLDPTTPTFDPGPYSGRILQGPDGTHWWSDGQRWTKVQRTAPPPPSTPPPSLTSSTAPQRAAGVASAGAQASQKARQQGLPGPQRAAASVAAEQHTSQAQQGLLQRIESGIGHAVQGAERTAANLPVISQIGQAARALSAPRYQAQFPVGSPQLDLLMRQKFPNGQDMFTADESGNLTWANGPQKGQPVTQNDLGQVLTAAATAGTAPGSRAVARGAAALTRRVGGPSGELEVRQAIRHGVERMTGIRPEGPVPAGTPSAPGVTIAGSRLAVRTTAGTPYEQDVAAANAAAQARTSVAVAEQDRAREASQNAVASAAAQRARNLAHPPVISQTVTPQIAGLLRQAWQHAQQETGAINLKPAADYLAKVNATLNLTGDLATKLEQLRGKGIADDLGLRPVIRGIERAAAPGDLEAVYHALEDQSHRLLNRLSPAQLQLYRVLAPIRDATAQLKLTIDPAFRPVTGVDYVRRFALGQGGFADRVARAVTGRSMGGLLRRTSDALKRRTYQTLVDTETGARHVVSVDQGRVTRWANGTGEFLGTLARRKTQGQFLAQDIAPLQRRLTALQGQLRAAEAATGRPGLQQQMVEDVVRRIQRTASAIVEQSRGTYTTGTQMLRQELRDLGRDYRDWSRAAGTMEQINGRIRNIQTAIDRIRGQYDPTQLGDLVFRAKNGRTYRFAEPTTAEIEGATKTRYLKNAAVSVLYDHLETAKIARANQFLKDLTADPTFLSFAAPRTNPMANPNWTSAWRGVPGLPQLSGYVMDPKIAAVFDRLVPHTHDPNWVLDGLTALSRLSVNVGFINPFVHTPNVGAFWAWDRSFRWVNLAAYRRLMISSTRAVNAALHYNQDYLDILGRGGALMRGRDQETHEALLKMAHDELQQDPGLLNGLAGNLGINARQILASPLWLSHTLTWLSNDVAYMQRIFEREMEGATRDAAIADTDRFFPTYRIPAQVLHSTGIANALRNRGFVLFAPYHYGVMKAIGQSFKGLLAPGMSLSQRVDAATKLAMLGIVVSGVVPAHTWLQQQAQRVTGRPVKLPGEDEWLNQTARDLTGNPRARATIPGPFRVPEDLARSASDELPWVYTLEGSVSPTPLVRGVTEGLQKMDMWTDPVLTGPENAAVLMKIVAGGYVPLSVKQVAQEIATAGTQPGAATKAALNGVLPVVMSSVLSQPKKSSAEYAVADMIHNRRGIWESRARVLAEAGQTDKAQAMLDRYNAQFAKWVDTALRAQGVSDATERSFLVDRFVRVYGAKLSRNPRQAIPGEPELMKYLPK